MNNNFQEKKKKKKSKNETIELIDIIYKYTVYLCEILFFELQKEKKLEEKRRFFKSCI